MKHCDSKTKRQILQGICIPYSPFIDVWIKLSIDDYYVAAYKNSPEEYHILAKSIDKYWELIDASL